MHITIDDLEPGQKATITSLAGLPIHIRQKFIDMGLSKGVEIIFIHRAPLGDPVWLRLRGYDLAFRRNLAAKIVVSR